MFAQLLFAGISPTRRRWASKIHRLALDRLRGQHKWRMSVRALDSATGIAIVFVRGTGGNVLEVRVPAGNQVVRCAIDGVSLAHYPVPKLMWILTNLQKTSPSMELRGYNYVTDTVGELISGPPPKS